MLVLCFGPINSFVLRFTILNFQGNEAVGFLVVVQRNDFVPKLNSSSPQTLLTSKLMSRKLCRFPNSKDSIPSLSRKIKRNLKRLRRNEDLWTNTPTLGSDFERSTSHQKLLRKIDRSIVGDREVDIDYKNDPGTDSIRLFCESFIASFL